jgi:hypothetical protein
VVVVVVLMGWLVMTMPPPATGPVGGSPSPSAPASFSVDCGLRLGDDEAACSDAIATAIAALGPRHDAVVMAREESLCSGTIACTPEAARTFKVLVVFADETRDLVYLARDPDGTFTATGTPVPVPSASRPTPATGSPSSAGFTVTCGPLRDVSACARAMAAGVKAAPTSYGLLMSIRLSSAPAPSCTASVCSLGRQTFVATLTMERGRSEVTLYQLHDGSFTTTSR